MLTDKVNNLRFATWDIHIYIRYNVLLEDIKKNNFAHSEIAYIEQQQLMTTNPSSSLTKSALERKTLDPKVWDIFSGFYFCFQVEKQ